MPTATQQDYEERILRVLVHIQTRLDCALELDELAMIANFSPFHFHRVFRGMVGEPVMEHIRRLRLERAAYHLKCSNRPVTQIAFDAGFETHEAFTRAFKAMFATPPSTFREQHRPVPSVPSGVHFAPDGRLEGFHPVAYQGAKMNVRIEELKPLRVVFIRHVGPYNQVGATWGRLCQWAGMRGLFGPDSQCLGGRYAVATHHGPYEKLGETYAALSADRDSAGQPEAPARANPARRLTRTEPRTSGSGHATTSGDRSLTVAALIWWGRCRASLLRATTAALPRLSRGPDC